MASTINEIADDIDSLAISNCFHCSPEDCETYLKPLKNQLSILHFNIRSINCNFDQLLILLKRICTKCDIIVLSECWLSVAERIPVLDGYTSYRSDYSNQNDGVVFYIRNGLEYSIYQPTTLVNASGFVLKFKNEFALIGLYRSPNNVDKKKSIAEFIDGLSNTITSLADFKTVAIVGDININIIPHCNDLGSEDYLATMASLGFLPAHQLPTHFRTSLDHVMLKTNLNSVTLVFDTYPTDHVPTLLCCELQSKNINHNLAFKKVIDHAAIVAELERTDFSATLASTDPNEASCSLICTLSEIIKNNTEIVKIPRHKRILKPWITPGFAALYSTQGQAAQEIKKEQ